MEDENRRSAERQQRRSAQACQNCRAQKGRCSPSELPGTCERSVTLGSALDVSDVSPRCLRLKKVCVPHIPKAHAERGVGNSKKSFARVEARIGDLEKIVDHALLSTPYDATSACGRGSIEASPTYSPADTPPPMAPSAPLEEPSAQQWPRFSFGAKLLELFDPGAYHLNQQVIVLPCSW